MARTNKVKEAFMQYSKKMCTRVTIFWMLYRIANFVVVLLRPETAKALVDLTTGVDTIMIVNIGFYTGNSATEKIAIAFGKRKSLYTSDDEEEVEEQEDEADNG
ncbi:MAG: hypothetical protein J6Y78_16080 [Paludibacteraceae bacterium]|nr:hypothetical protein [Paludibacteraceae bacterium]